MLSTEDTPPSDPHEISSEGVDLSIPSLDDQNSLPKFSIRDYVFNNRNKDIKKNWPFSEESLQLCLKHGVKDLLPPFNSLDRHSSQSSERVSVVSSSSDKRKVTSLEMEPSIEAGTINLSGFGNCDKQLPGSSNNPPPPPREVLPKTSEKSRSHLLKKLEISKPPLIKKCKVVEKGGPSWVEPKSNSNTPLTVAEPKQCPICKTFSSSSNTKLNAHIDQCLSVDPPTEPSSESRVIKPTIKPKKTRSIVDIYATALYCTVEELDRRNGRIWSEKPSLPTIQEEDVDSGEEKSQSVGFDEKGDDGDVYVDANGTKLRILNKTSETILSKVKVNPHPLGKPYKGGKTSKIHSIKKKKRKHSKSQALSDKMENPRSYKTRLASRILGDEEKDESMEESEWENENMDETIPYKSSKSRKQIIDLETIAPKGASSIRANHLKRRFQDDSSSSQDSDMERSYSQEDHDSDELPHWSSQEGNGIDYSSYKDPVRKYHDLAPLKKFKSFQSQSARSVDVTLSSSRKEMLLLDKSSSSEPKISENSHHYDHQDSIENVPGQAPLGRSTILKIKKKKLPAISSNRNDFTQDHTTHFRDGFLDEEPYHGGKMFTEQPLGTEAENVISLNKSFDQEFYSIGEADMGREMSPTDMQESYFLGVDRITIPGPPGSFLPSPGRSSSDEDHQVNSSLTTSQVQSSLDHFEIVDRDSLNSPKSLNSTVSNPLLSRSNSKLPENLSREPLVPQDEIIKLGFSSEITMNIPGFQDGHQPGCCPRKEGISGNYIGFGPRSVNVPVKPPIYGDFGSPSPSSPNPVLRLMGKDLMVVNTEDNLNYSPNSKFHAGTLDNDNVVRYNSPFYGSLSSPLSPLGRVEAQRKEESNEVQTEGKNVVPASSGGFPVSTDGYYNSSFFNPFYSSYQGVKLLPYNRGPHMMMPNNASLSMAPPNPGVMSWNNSVLEGSSMQMPQNPFSLLPSSNHVRSSLYYPPRMP